MKPMRRCDIRTLKRRRDFLAERFDRNGKSDTGYSFDRAEHEALSRAIDILDNEDVRLADAEETEV